MSALCLRPTHRPADRSAESTDRSGGPTDPSDWPTDRATDQPPDRPVAARLSRWTDPTDQPNDQQPTNETGRPSSAGPTDRGAAERRRVGVSVACRMAQNAQCMMPSLYFPDVCRFRREDILRKCAQGSCTYSLYSYVFSSSRDGHSADEQAYSDFREVLREYTLYI